MLLLPTPSAAPASMLMACGLTHSGVPIRVGGPLCLGRKEVSLLHPSPTMLWDLGGHLCSHVAPVQEVSLASAAPSTGALPTSCTEESDSPAFMTGILWTGFSARLLSLQQSEAATTHCHASIRGKRLMVKWAEHEIHSEKASSMWARIACVVSWPKP